MKGPCLVRLVCAGLAMASPVLAAAPLGTAFTYQGQLKQDGLAVNGTVDLEFTLWDAPIGGGLVGPPVFSPAVQVTNGLFTVEVDFPAPVFLGDDRWLQVAVNGIILESRQRITAAPYAHFAARPWELSEGSLTYSGGNVGVGTTTPARQLHVLSTSSDAARFESLDTLSTRLEIRNQSSANWFALTTTGMDSNIGPGNFFIGEANGTTVIRRLVIDPEGDVGIGISSPATKLHVVDSGTVPVRIESSNTTATRLEIRNQSIANWFALTTTGTDSNVGSGKFFIGEDNGTTVAPRLLIDPNGNVGIGTSVPAGKLEVHAAQVGDGIRITGNGSNSPGLKLYEGATERGALGLALINGAWSTSALDGDIVLRAMTGKLLLQNGFGEAAIALSGNNVGVGTTNPESKLHVRTNVNQRGVMHSDGTHDLITWLGSSEGTEGAWIGPTTNHSISLQTNNVARLTVTADGGVGIGTVDPGSFKLAVNGDAAKPGGGEWSVLSDERIKTNIEPLRGALNRVLSLRGVTFEFNEHGYRTGLALPGRQVGFLAQQVEEVFPEWVAQTSNGYKYITERGTTALLVEALRELRAEKDAEFAALREEKVVALAALREEKDAEIAAIRARLERLERMMNQELGAVDSAAHARRPMFPPSAGAQ